MPAFPWPANNKTNVMMKTGNIHA